MIKTEDIDTVLLPKGAIAKEIKVWMSRKDLRQKWLAATLGITVPSVSDKLKGITPFTTDELMTIAGALGLSLSELLGEDIVNAKLPAPSYIEEKGKKKVAPIGFIPKGATYQIISGEECALWGSNPRPADYQTQHRAKPRHADTYTTAPHRGFFLALLLWMCNQSQRTERRKPCFGNHSRATLRPGNSLPEKQPQPLRPAHIGSSTSRAPTHPRQP